MTVAGFIIPSRRGMVRLLPGLILQVPGPTAVILTIEDSADISKRGQ